MKPCACTAERRRLVRELFFRARDAATKRALKHQVRPWSLAIFMAAEHRQWLRMHGRSP